MAETSTNISLTVNQREQHRSRPRRDVRRPRRASTTRQLTLLASAIIVPAAGGDGKSSLRVVAPSSLSLGVANSASGAITGQQQQSREQTNISRLGTTLSSSFVSNRVSREATVLPHWCNRCGQNTDHEVHLRYSNVSTLPIPTGISDSNDSHYSPIIGYDLAAMTTPAPSEVALAGSSQSNQPSWQLPKILVEENRRIYDMHNAANSTKAAILLKASQRNSENSVWISDAEKYRVGRLELPPCVTGSRLFNGFLEGVPLLYKQSQKGFSVKGIDNPNSKNSSLHLHPPSHAPSETLADAVLSAIPTISQPERQHTIQILTAKQKRWRDIHAEPKWATNDAGENTVHVIAVAGPEQNSAGNNRRAQTQVLQTPFSLAPRGRLYRSKPNHTFFATLTAAAKQAAGQNLSRSATTPLIIKNMAPKPPSQPRSTYVGGVRDLKGKITAWIE